jgi:hypothetical protein
MNASKKTKIEAQIELPERVTGFAQQSVDRAQAAFEQVSDAVHGNVQVFDAAASAFKSCATELQMKAIEIAQANVNAVFAFTRKAFAAKDVNELVSLNQDFVRDQAQTLTRQAGEINALSLQLAKETVKPWQDSMTKSFGDYTKMITA